jgi:hypothetical protein
MTRVGRFRREKLKGSASCYLLREAKEREIGTKEAINVSYWYGALDIGSYARNQVVAATRPVSPRSRPERESFHGYSVILGHKN